MPRLRPCEELAVPGSIHKKENTKNIKEITNQQAEQVVPSSIAPAATSETIVVVEPAKAMAAPTQVVNVPAPAPAPVRQIEEIFDFGSHTCKQALDLYWDTFASAFDVPTNLALKFLSQGRYRLFVIRDHEQLGGDVAACALVAVFPELDVVHLDYVCVSSKVRGGGLGSIMFKELVNTFRSEQRSSSDESKKWIAMTLQCQPHLLAWYQKMGAIDAGLVDLEEDGKTFKFLQVPLVAEGETPASTEHMEEVYDELYTCIWTPAELANFENLSNSSNNAATSICDNNNTLQQIGR
eukprot:GEZU01004260.1.p1 GENE.GEZU01004260.1~~GEZU01004260.1.p1  ORF type:complete len:295 (-),score=94.00 GEZU01004260.1:790-1674(-)